MSKRDGMPVPMHTYQCPFCECELEFMKRTSIGVVWAHWYDDTWVGWNYTYPQPCPNNAALFITREAGAKPERLEPIV